MSNNDVLVEIPNEDLPELAEMYLKYHNDLPQVYSTIINGIKWKKTSDEALIKFYSPNNDWRKDGTFFCYMQFNCNDIFISTLSENNSGIYEGLTSSKLNYEHLLFFCIHYKSLPVIKKFIQEKNLEELYDLPCSMYTISMQKALEFNIDCPDEVYIKQLDRSAAEIVNSAWPHSYDGSDDFLATLIELNKAFGVFLKNDNKLVAWLLQSSIGQMGMLQTLDGYKRRGYGLLILKYMSKELAKDRIQPFATVLESNIAAKKMFERLQFHNLGMSNYIRVKFN